MVLKALFTQYGESLENVKVVWSEETYLRLGTVCALDGMLSKMHLTTRPQMRHMLSVCNLNQKRGEFQYVEAERKKTLEVDLPDALSSL
jgi:hypothetical protein